MLYGYQYFNHCEVSSPATWPPSAGVPWISFGLLLLLGLRLRGRLVVSILSGSAPNP